jgi:hypothetical protein
VKVTPPKSVKRASVQRPITLAGIQHLLTGLEEEVKTKTKARDDVACDCARLKDA